MLDTKNDNPSFNTPNDNPSLNSPNVDSYKKFDYLRKSGPQKGINSVWVPKYPHIVRVWDPIQL